MFKLTTNVQSIEKSMHRFYGIHFNELLKVLEPFYGIHFNELLKMLSPFYGIHFLCIERLRYTFERSRVIDPRSYLFPSFPLKAFNSWKIFLNEPLEPSYASGNSP